jgi:curli biogenesis system outer membrane secretion channel CsgG
MNRSMLAAIAAVLCAGCATNPNDAYFMETPTKANVYVAPGHAAVRKVAVLPFKAPTELIGASVADMFVTELLRSGRYELVERSQMASVLGEQELALAGLSAAKAAEVGTMLGADGVIIGTVSEYETVAKRGRTIPVAGISTRLIECGSGRIVWSVDLADRAERSDTTLSEHGRHVVHEMMAGLYREQGRVK